MYGFHIVCYKKNNIRYNIGKTIHSLHTIHDLIESKFNIPYLFHLRLRRVSLPVPVRQIPW